MRQVITGELIVWDTWGPNDPEPFTEFGAFYEDYDVSVDALIEREGTVKIFGRTKYFESNKGAHGYGLVINEHGEWKLMRFLTPLASGKVSFGAERWYNLALRFRGDIITAFVDGNEIASVKDGTYSKGYAGIGSGWNFARFDNLKMKVR